MGLNSLTTFQFPCHLSLKMEIFSFSSHAIVLTSHSFFLWFSVLFLKAMSLDILMGMLIFNNFHLVLVVNHFQKCLFPPGAFSLNFPCSVVIFFVNLIFYPSVFLPSHKEGSKQSQCLSTEKSQLDLWSVHLGADHVSFPGVVVCVLLLPSIWYCQGFLYGTKLGFSFLLCLTHQALGHTPTGLLLFSTMYLMFHLRYFNLPEFNMLILSSPLQILLSPPQLLFRNYNSMQNCMQKMSTT